MSAPRSSDAVLQETVNVVAECEGNQALAGRRMKLPRGTIQARVEQAKGRGITPNGGRVEADDPKFLRDTIRRLKAELKSAASENLTRDKIRTHVFEMKDKAREAQSLPWLVAARPPADSPGVPTLFLSDFHWGEVVHPSQINGVNEFNLEIARDRLGTTIEVAIRLLQILDPQMRYPGIVAMLGGDMISGNIHDELQATNELNTMPTVLDLYGYLIAGLKRLAERFGRVFVPCVSGNHGRDTHKIWAKDRNHTSFDWLLYCLLAKHFEDDKRITFQIPDGSDAFFRVYGHRYLLTHGDQFRGGDGMIGALGPIIRGDHKKRSRNAQIAMEYDTMCLGHWHQYIHHSRVIVNGSLKGYDEYAYQNNFGFEPPQQGLWVTHPRYGITYRMPVRSDRIRTAPKTEWVSVPKNGG